MKLTPQPTATPPPVFPQNLHKYRLSFRPPVLAPCKILILLGLISKILIKKDLAVFRFPVMGPTARARPHGRASYSDVAILSRVSSPSPCPRSGVGQVIRDGEHDSDRLAILGDGLGAVRQRGLKHLFKMFLCLLKCPCCHDGSYKLLVSARSIIALDRRPWYL